MLMIVPLYDFSTFTMILFFLVIGSIMTWSNQSMSQDVVELSRMEAALFSLLSVYAEREDKTLTLIQIESWLQTQEFLLECFLISDLNESAIT